MTMTKKGLLFVSAFLVLGLLVSGSSDFAQAKAKVVQAQRDALCGQQRSEVDEPLFAGDALTDLPDRHNDETVADLRIAEDHGLVRLADRKKGAGRLCLGLQTHSHRRIGLKQLWRQLYDPGSLGAPDRGVETLERR